MGRHSEEPQPYFPDLVALVPHTLLEAIALTGDSRLQREQYKTVHIHRFLFTESFQKQLDFANTHSLFISFLRILSLRHWKHLRGMASHLRIHLIQADLSKPCQEYPGTKARGTWDAENPPVVRSLSHTQHP